MSEQHDLTPYAEHDEDGPVEPLRTGNSAVDGVLDSLDGLDSAPVDEHVGVFERAHTQLRAALDAEPAPPSESTDDAPATGAGTGD